MTYGGSDGIKSRFVSAKRWVERLAVILVIASIAVIADSQSAESAERIPCWALSSNQATAAMGENDVVFVLASRPKNNRFDFPRLNNVLKTITVMDQTELGNLTLTQTSTVWTIHLPNEVEFPAAVRMSLHGRPRHAAKPVVIQPASNGEICLPAHHAIVHGQKLQYEPQPHKNTVGYWVDPEAWVEWHLEIEKAGRYRVRILQGCGAGQGGSHVEMRVFDEKVPFVVEETGHFQNFVWRDLDTLDLPAGRGRLTLTPTLLAKSAVMDVRQIRLVPLDRRVNESLQLSDVPPDLAFPPLLEHAEPKAGRRVRLSVDGYNAQHVSHIVYLPTDWRPGRTFPVLVELPGNGGFKSELGDVCTGRVADAKMGYGISGGHGYICVTLPFLDSQNRTTTKWWGEPPAFAVAPSLDYWKRALQSICDLYGGDSEQMVLIGFSRGSLACNYLGLYDDAIANRWKAIVCASHYDGVRDWPYPESDRSSAIRRLQRLGDRPQFICHEMGGKQLLDAARELATEALPEGDFTFATTGFVNHSDAWTLRPGPCRAAVRDWLKQVGNQRE